MPSPSARLAPCAGSAWTTTLIAGRRQLLHVLHLYVEHDNRHRPHRGLDLSTPEPSERCEQADPSAAARQLHRRDVLGGLIHEYERAA